MSAVDVAAIRRDFAILGRRVHGKPLAYLDSAATSQKPRQVLDAMRVHYQEHNANVHRGAHQLSVEATESYEAARRSVAAFLGAPDPRSLVFTRGTTEALNLVVGSWGRANLREGDEVVVTVAEHHANLVPWHLLRRERAFRIVPVGLTADQQLDMAALEAALSERTKAVATFHMSNVLGSVNDLRAIAELAHRRGAVLIVDGAQGAPHLPVDVVELGCDFYALSAHKMLGPTGIGALWAHAELLESMPPFLGGGDMIRRVRVDDSSYADIPARFEAGTPSVAEAVGFAAAITYLEAIGMDAIAARDAELARYAFTRLREVEGVTTYGPAPLPATALPTATALAAPREPTPRRGGLVSFNLEGVHAHDLATALDEEGVAVRSGHHCAQPLHDRLGLAASVRASFYLYTTEDEIDRLVTGVVRVRDHFRAFA